MDKKVTLAQLKEVVQEAYDQVKTNTGGKNADYIPYLANVNKDLFGISVCLLNGQTIHVGDTDYRFGIESVSKVHTAILALRQYGAKEILDKIGADATGLPFNSIIAILLENDHPSTPLVNAGAISACSMVKPIGDSAKKWDAIVGNVTDLCGSAPQLIDELYKSESDTNFNNRSIAWLLKNYNRIYDNPDSKQVINLVDGLMLVLHLFVNAEEMLHTAVNLGLDVGILHVLLYLFHNSVDKFFSCTLTESNFFYKVIIDIRFQIFKGKIIQLHLDLGNTESVSKRRVDLDGLSRLLLLFFRAHILKRPHIVETVRKLDDNDADIFCHGEEHFS